MGARRMRGSVRLAVVFGALLLLTLVFPARSAHAAATWQAVTIPGLPAGSSLGEVWARSSSDVYVWATRTTPSTESWLYHWNGTSWTPALSLVGHIPADVHGTGASQVIASSLQGSTAHVYRSESGGAIFTEDTLPAPVTDDYIHQLSGPAGNVQAIAGPNIIRFDGTSWAVVLPPPTIGPGDSTPYALHMHAANEGYFNTCWGWGAWNGTAWSYSGIQFDFCDAYNNWSTRDATGLHVYAIGSNNFQNGVRVWKFNESAGNFGCKFCFAFSDGSSGSALGGWGSGSADVYVIGRLFPGDPDIGRLYHYDGSAWARVTAVDPFPEPVDVGGSGREDVWVSLTNGTLLHYAPIVDTTPPSCTIVESGKDQSGRAFIRFRVDDVGHGLSRHEVVYLRNGTVSIDPYAVGSLGPVYVLATAIDPAKSVGVTVNFYDLAGNRGVCDPVVYAVARVDGQPQDEVFTGLPQAESKVTIQNGDPGMDKVRLTVNGVKFKEYDVEDGEVRKLDVASAMQPGDDNTIAVRVSGKKGASALIVIADID